MIEDARERNIPALVIECDRKQLASRRIAEKHSFQVAGKEDGLLLYRRRFEDT